MEGLLITYVALNLMDGHGQPALLYIVPFTLGNFWLFFFFHLFLGPIRVEELKAWVPLHSADKNLRLVAGTFLMLGRKRGDLRVLWTRGEPERPCPHIQLEHQNSEELNDEK